MVTLATTLGSLSLVLNSVRDGGEPERGRRARAAKVAQHPQRRATRADRAAPSRPSIRT